MAITWGSAVGSGWNQMALGYEFTLDNVNDRINLKVYFVSRSCVSDSSNSFTISGDWSYSGSVAISTSSTGSSSALTPDSWPEANRRELYSGTITIPKGYARAFSASLSGIAIVGATATVTATSDVNPTVTPTVNYVTYQPNINIIDNGNNTFSFTIIPGIEVSPEHPYSDTKGYGLMDVYYTTSYWSAAENGYPNIIWVDQERVQTSGKTYGPYPIIKSCEVTVHAATVGWTAQAADSYGAMAHRTILWHDPAYDFSAVDCEVEAEWILSDTGSLSLKIKPNSKALSADAIRTTLQLNSDSTASDITCNIGVLTKIDTNSWTLDIPLLNEVALSHFYKAKNKGNFLIPIDGNVTIDNHVYDYNTNIKVLISALNGNVEYSKKLAYRKANGDIYFALKIDLPMLLPQSIINSGIGSFPLKLNSNTATLSVTSIDILNETTLEITGTITDTVNNNDYYFVGSNDLLQEDEKIIFSMRISNSDVLITKEKFQATEFIEDDYGLLLQKGSTIHCKKIKEDTNIVFSQNNVIIANNFMEE